MDLHGKNSLLALALSVALHGLLLASGALSIDLPPGEKRGDPSSRQSEKAQPPAEDETLIGKSSGESFLLRNFPGFTARQERGLFPVITSNGYQPPPLPRFFTSGAQLLATTPKQGTRLKLLPPEFSAGTVPAKPALTMQDEIDARTKERILSDIIKDSLPLDYSPAELDEKEAYFTEEVAADLADGLFDMEFSRFIITAEYFQLSRVLMERGRKPSFTLEQALDRFAERLESIGRGLNPELEIYDLIMLLQRYVDDKYYPDQGSGMLLDSLFHNLNDCESGTKEILAYLDALYPDLETGTNRGVMKVPGNKVVGHMQAYIFPGPSATRIVENDNGITIETTLIDQDSVRAHSAGDIYPLADFVLRYYPHIYQDSPLGENMVLTSRTVDDNVVSRVGVGNHALKMEYGPSSALLSGRQYDLETIRSRQLANGFLQSPLSPCDPQIDAGAVHSYNVMSNFVVIEPALRKKLITHYLAAIPYWDNRVMPQWKDISSIPTYDNLAATLLEQDHDPDREVELLGSRTIPLDRLRDHRSFLLEITSRGEEEEREDPFWGAGEVTCTSWASLDRELLSYLFTAGEGPGLFFLPGPPENFPWQGYAESILNNCFTLPPDEDDRTMITDIENAALFQGSSFRERLYARALGRGLAVSDPDEALKRRKGVIRSVFAGERIENSGDTMKSRRSSISTGHEPSVEETIRQRGRSGINRGILEDAYDFLGKKQLLTLLRDYGGRGDLVLSLQRASFLMQYLLHLEQLDGTDRGEIAESLQALYGQEMDYRLRFTAGSLLAREGMLDGKTLSRDILAFLKNNDLYEPAVVIDLLQYGLAEEDLVSFYRAGLAGELAALPTATMVPGEGADRLEPFHRLVDILQLTKYFNDRGAASILFAGVVKSVRADFRAAASGRAAHHVDLSVLFNKLGLLALAAEETEERIESPDFLTDFLPVAGRIPAGIVMLGLVERAYDEASLAESLRGLIARQEAELAALDTEYRRSGSLFEKGPLGAIDRRFLGQLTRLVGEANIIAVALARQHEGQLTAFGFLQDLHTRISRTALFERRTVETYETGQNIKEVAIFASAAGLFDRDFYLTDAVVESFSLLSFLSPGTNEAEKILFRRLVPITEIPEDLDLEVTEATRILTRQDMSMLTLLLNENNEPATVAEALAEIIRVTERLSAAQPLDEEAKTYFFSPHYPYLSANNEGFLYSPEAIENIRKIDSVSGSFDVLVNSYLHFRNLPGRMPDWLLRAAVRRSEYEQRRIEAYEQLTFLPLINECEQDNRRLARGFFNAKWRLRKSFGEDSMPATLLLLRLGYLDIGPGGQWLKSDDYRMIAKSL